MVGKSSEKPSRLKRQQKDAGVMFGGETIDNELESLRE